VWGLKIHPQPVGDGLLVRGVGLKKLPFIPALQESAGFYQPDGFAGGRNYASYWSNGFAGGKNFATTGAW